MCGIAGAFSFQDCVEPFNLDLIRHRGPDSQGEWSSADGRLWLGMTRLAILDLSPTGNQPMNDPITGNVIVHNGEIYNHLSLRPELEKLGARFLGTSDTETLLAAYRFWGTKMFAKLKGMFAFAIYDNSDKSVILARDRFGIKPLYFHSQPDEFIFASEVRGIAQRKELGVTRESIAAYLQWGSCPHSCLLFPELAEFPVGSYMRLTTQGASPAAPFWSPQQAESASKQIRSRSALVRQTRELLEKSVSEHILSDVPIACFLSGGVDSSVITALAARQLNRELHTFSVGFDQESHDESAYARRIAAQYSTDHMEIRLSAEEVIETAKEAVLRMDLPSLDGVNSYIVAKQVATQGFKVALAGIGGDELFGGYPHFRLVPRLKYLAIVPPAVLQTLLRFNRGRHLLTDMPRRVDAGLFAQWWRRSWNAWMLHTAGLPDRPIPAERRPELLDDFAEISWAELRHYMRDVLLRDSDQMSMAVSLEVRVPFLDHELVEFVLGVPAMEKSRPNFVKWLLVESVRDLIPAEIYNRQKMGFELPMSEWMRGPLHEFTEAGLRLLANRAPWFSAATLDHLHRGFNAGSFAWQKLWALVVLGWYLEKQGITAHDQDRRHSSYTAGRSSDSPRASVKMNSLSLCLKAG